METDRSNSMEMELYGTIFYEFVSLVSLLDA